MRAEYISSVLLKIFNSIRAEKSTGPGDQISRNASYETRQQVAVTSRKAVILFVANSLCRLYFNLRTPSSCANVFSNIHTAKVKFAGFSQAEKVEYRYYLGRFYLMKNQLVSAYKHLRYSFDNCLATSGRNRQLILHYLIPASLLLGKLPSLYLLDSSGLDPVYGPLVQAVRRCDYTSYMAYLEEEPRRSWLLRRGLYVALRYRVEVLFHRNVLYQTWKANDRKNVLSYQAITTAFALSKTGHPDELLHRQDTEFMLLESVLASLISQRLVRANIFSRSSMLRLRDVNPIPKLVEVHDIKESTVLEADEQWMRD
ncbi:hypothetical protein TRVA0_013S01530 [Trichomonascus vanleenenianus]|uniref:Thp1p n=1 Tax=Trichomonascus vanleenenianus TaxID=2268995 RepID=UPI003EC9D0F0